MKKKTEKKPENHKQQRQKTNIQKHNKKNIGKTKQ